MSVTDNFPGAIEKSYEIATDTWKLLEEMRYQSYRLKIECVSVCHSGHYSKNQPNSPAHQEYMLMRDTDPVWRALSRQLQNCRPFKPAVVDSIRVRVPEPVLIDRAHVVNALENFITSAVAHGRVRDLVVDASESEARLWRYQGPRLGPALQSAADILQEYCELGLRDKVLADLTRVANIPQVMPQKPLALPAPTVSSQPPKPL